MTRRPERLKATKLYSSVQSDDKNEHPVQRTNQQQALEVKPTPHEASKQKSKPTESDLNNNVAKPGGDLIISNQISQAHRESKGGSREMNSIFEAKAKIPTGYVTRKQMEEKVNKKNGIHDNEKRSEKKTGPPKGFVTRNEMEEKVNKKKGINGSTKTELNSGLPKGFVTRKEMEQKILTKKEIIHEKHSTHLPVANDHKEIKTKTESSTKGNSTEPETKTENMTPVHHRKTKTTKVSSTYIHVNAQSPKPTMQKETTPSGRQGDSKAKLFSKLENKKNVSGGSKGRILTKELNLRTQDQTTNKKDKETTRVLNSNKLTLPLNEKHIIETVDVKSKPNAQTKTKNINPNRDETTYASTRKSATTVTPRMTSTAITKTPKGNAKSNMFSAVNLDSIRILIMNANGKDDKGGTPTERRKNAIQNVVVKHAPTLVLFQEFSWVGISGKAWMKYPLPEQFVYKGHYDASIMYDESCIQVQDLPASDIDTILRGLQSNASNRLKRTFPMDFNPIARMCITRITGQTKPALDFICISWHGKSNEIGGGRMKELKKIEYFEYWMEFLRNIREKYKLPILAAGDYNVDMYSVEHCVQNPFKLCIYEASMRRTVRGIVDFCIVTEDLAFSDITWVNLERDTAVFHPNGILDHDPVVGSLTVSALAMTEAAIGIGKKKAWPSPIAKYK